jgi:hypothetical protein
MKAGKIGSTVVRPLEKIVKNEGTNTASTFKVISQSHGFLVLEVMRINIYASIARQGVKMDSKRHGIRMRMTVDG